MGRHKIGHPPCPTGATKPELDRLHRLHRAGTTSDDEASRPAMMDGVRLIVELIEARNRRQSFTDQWEHSQETGWAE